MTIVDEELLGDMDTLQGRLDDTLIIKSSCNANDNERCREGLDMTSKGRQIGRYLLQLDKLRPTQSRHVANWLLFFIAIVWYRMMFGVVVFCEDIIRSHLQPLYLGGVRYIASGTNSANFWA
jgi:hypothetical protein